MKQSELIDFHKDVAEKCREIMKNKNDDYSGQENKDALKNFKMCEKMGICSAEKGILTRMVDKMMRISTFEKDGELSTKDESVNDTIDDLINYSVLLKAVIDDKKDSDDEASKDKSTSNVRVDRGWLK